MSFGAPGKHKHMKIAFFTDTYYPQLNGVTISVDNFAQELRKKGHTVYIFAPRIKKSRKKDENLTNLPSIKILSSEHALYIPVPTSYTDYAKIFKLDIDIIHAHGNGAFTLLGYQVARMKRIPFVLTFHTQLTKYTHYFLKGKVIRPQMIEKALQMYANISDGVITPSEKMKKELRRYGVTKPIHVIPNFVEKDIFVEVQKNYLHKRFGLPKDSPILLSVGRLGKEKNFEFVIEMFAELAKTEDKSHLVIVGSGVERSHLKAKAEEKGISKRVHFTGRINKKFMPSVYDDATLFVFASTSEVHPLVALEACTAGLPLIVAKDDAFKNVVVDGKNGYQLPLQTKRFVEKIQLLLTDSSLRKSMGAYSTQIVDTYFPADKLADMLLKVYRQTKPPTERFDRLRSMNTAAMLRLKKTMKLLDRFFR